MCGIVGYIGKRDAYPVLIKGLHRLEYRGYDSAGVALISPQGKLNVYKTKGKVADLETFASDKDVSGTIGIAHTRWATHGEPNSVNAHPHYSESEELAIIHNGIIENYAVLKQGLQQHGYTFRSETDTEVLVQLIEYTKHTDNVDLKTAVQLALNQVVGAYAIAVLDRSNPNIIVAARKGSPLVVGIGEDEYFLASDATPIVEYTDKVVYINDEEVVTLERGKEIDITTIGNVRKTPEIKKLEFTLSQLEKGGYPHFMLKEIYEQPKAISETISRRLDASGKIRLDGISLTKEDLAGISRIYIVACGTAYHAGLVGKYVIERLAKIPVEVDVASEFRYRDPLVDDRTLFIAISQSGETLDTLAALRAAKAKGARVLSVVNVVGSSVARESDDVFYTWAGPEIAVASTKAYTTQLTCMYLLGLHMGRTLDRISEADYHEMVEALREIPGKLAAYLQDVREIEALAKMLYNRDQVFFIGRGLDAAVSYEGSLKLKEISYINSFAIAAGELKHGTIALMEPGTLVLCLATQDALYEKMLSNIQEIKARGAHVLAIAKEGNRAVEAQSNEVIYIPDCRDELAPLLSVVPLQLFAYYVAKERGCNIDKPKNLAKSVTVE